LSDSRRRIIDTALSRVAQAVDLFIVPLHPLSLARMGQLAETPEPARGALSENTALLKPTFTARSFSH